MKEEFKCLKKSNLILGNETINLINLVGSFINRLRQVKTGCQGVKIW